VILLAWAIGACLMTLGVGFLHGSIWCQRRVCQRSQGAQQSYRGPRRGQVDLAFPLQALWPGWLVDCPLLPSCPWLAHYPDERHRMGEAGRKRIEETFSLEAVLPQRRTIYQNELGRKEM